MTEVWFYHLRSQPLERAMPALIEKAVQRGWRVIVQTVDEARVKALDDLLWTYTPASFLPHGSASESDAAHQPILVTRDTGNPNDAAMRMYVDSAEIVVDPATTYERIILMFDGRKDEALASARRQWSRLKAEGVTLAYWQQGDDGRWDRKM